MINHTVFEGYTLKDLKIHADGHTNMLTFNLSQPRIKKDNEGNTVFNTISFVAFGKTAELLDGVTKNTLISVEAELRSFTQVNTEGKMEYKESKVVNKVHFIDRSKKAKDFSGNQKSSDDNWNSASQT